MQDSTVMPNSDVKQVLELLSKLSEEFRDVKEFLLRHTTKIESIELLAARITDLEKELAVIKSNFKQTPSYRESIQTIAWLSVFALLVFQTFFK